MMWLQAGARNHKTAPAVAAAAPIITQVAADSASADQIQQSIQDDNQQSRSSHVPTASTQFVKSPEDVIMVLNYSRAAAPQSRPC
jgi:hypothetical protein